VSAVDHDEEVFDNPTEWVAAHLQQYLSTNGVQGHEYMGWPTLLLITRGRRSRKLRRTALIYGEDAERFVVVGSNGGQSGDPAWYLNLVANPDVTVQIVARTLQAGASTATADEQPRLWRLMTSIFPKYEEYAREAPRELPVVILTPRAPD
jgi:deazaflavin-dependent oxidoreductase (nitroreductase family)